MCSDSNMERDEKLKAFVCARLHHKLGHWAERTKPEVSGTGDTGDKWSLCAGASSAWSSLAAPSICPAAPGICDERVTSLALGHLCHIPMSQTHPGTSRHIHSGAFLMALTEEVSPSCCMNAELGNGQSSHSYKAFVQFSWIFFPVL